MVGWLQRFELYAPVCSSWSWINRSTSMRSLEPRGSFKCMSFLEAPNIVLTLAGCRFRGALRQWISCLRPRGEHDGGESDAEVAHFDLDGLFMGVRTTIQLFEAWLHATDVCMLVNVVCIFKCDWGLLICCWVLGYGAIREPHGCEVWSSATMCTFTWEPTIIGLQNLVVSPATGAFAC